MSWDRDSLFSKSRIYFERAFGTDREDEMFGLWCSMGLELLARSAISNFSPTLLAEPERDHKHLLIALELGSAKVAKKSISTNQVLVLCRTLIVDFTDEQYKLSTALANRRNEELHSGTAAFAEFSAQQWVSGFYKICKILAESQNECLVSLFGGEEAELAETIITEDEGKITEKIQSLIAAHRKVFKGKSKEEQERLLNESNVQGKALSHKQHHRVNCPSCECIATVQGDVYGQEKIENTEDEVIVRQSVIPTEFRCGACQLTLNGYGELASANVADHFTHRSHYSPAEYYDLVDENEARRTFEEEHGIYSFSNE